MIENTYEYAKHFGIISLGLILTSILILCIVYYKKEGKILSSISETVADNKKISLFFSIIMTISIPLYYLGALLYLFPRYNLPFICSLLLILAFCFEMLFIWIPSKDKKAKYHSILAFITAMIMALEMILILTLGQNIEFFTLIFSIILFLLAIVNFGIYKVRKKRKQKHTFLFEAIFIGAYILIVLILTYF